MNTCFFLFIFITTFFSEIVYLYLGGQFNCTTTITAEHLVVATNAPIFDKVHTFAKQESNRTYAIAISVPKETMEDALLWDTANPYHYVRQQPYDENNNLLIVGGEDHRTGESPEGDPFTKLEHWAHLHLSVEGDVVFKWSGQIQEPVDYLAFIGRIPVDEKNVYIITGDSGNGMTHGAISGMLISDLIMGKNNPWEAVYSPNRTTLTNISQLASHNLTSLISYGDYLMPGEVSSVEMIGNDDGAIVRKGLHRVAVYKDAQGTLHECPAVCTHMQAPLRWNPIEKSWDCPAHGSRFSKCGTAIQGPATKNLKD